MVRHLGAMGRIHFAHCRNVKHTGPRRFHESPHPTVLGDVDMGAVLEALRDTRFDGSMRPDHGRMIWGERGRPGYDLYDRALGATYLQGLWEACRTGSGEWQRQTAAAAATATATTTAMALLTTGTTREPH